MSKHGVLLADWFGDDKALAEHQRRMHDRLGFELDWVPRMQMADYVRTARYGSGLYEPGSFHFNPRAYAQAVAGRLVQLGARVHTRTPVVGVERRSGRWRIATRDVEILADRVVLATGGYERRLLPRIQRSIQPIATYIVVTEPLGDRLHELIPADVAIYDTRFAFDYYRPLSDGRLLWGGRISTADRDPSNLRRLMRRDIARVFPCLADARFDYAWGGWMSYALHQMPILREYENGLWLAHGSDCDGRRGAGRGHARRCRTDTSFQSVRAGLGRGFRRPARRAGSLLVETTARPPQSGGSADARSTRLMRPTPDRRDARPDWLGSSDSVPKPQPVPRSTQRTPRRSATLSPVGGRVAQGRQACFEARHIAMVAPGPSRATMNSSSVHRNRRL
jgi:hypothetical protein